MKRISFLLVAWALCTGPALRAQDAATEERLNKLAGRIEDLAAGQETLRKHYDGLAREIQELREQLNKPTGNYASAEDLKRVAKAVEEVDRKRLEDAKKLHEDLLGIKDSVTKGLKPPKLASQRSEEATPPTPKVSDNGYEYVVQKGDTLSIIVQAYRDKNIKVSMDQVLKANPGLKPEKMRVGQKVFIPAPQT